MAQDKTKDLAYMNDFQTPLEVANYMVSLIPEGANTILEPTPGLGNIVSALTGYDITMPDDYWQLDKSLRFDAVVGNMPFSSKTFFNCPAEFEGKGMIVAYEQLKTLMTMSDNLIVLMPWFTISDSDVRLRMIKRYGLILGKTEFIVYDLLTLKP